MSSPIWTIEWSKVSSTETSSGESLSFYGKHHLHVLYRKPIFRGGLGNTLKYNGKHAMATSRSQSVNGLKRAVLRILMDGWVRVLRPFNSISVILRRWEDEHERLCAMKRRLGSGRISPPAGFEPATPWSEVGSAYRSSTRTLLCEFWGSKYPS